MSTPAVVKLPLPQAAQAQYVPRLRVVRISRLDDLLALEPAWQALAEQAVEPNIFYEPWMMLPALMQFHTAISLEVYVVYADFLEGSRLVGFVPFEREMRAFGLRSRRRRLLRYYYCQLCTPLLDPEYGAIAMMELLQVVLRSGGQYEFSHVEADGPVMQAIVDAMQVFHHALDVTMIARAQHELYENADAYMAATFKPKKQRVMQKRERQLSEHGELLYDSLQPSDSVITWIDEFLDLESSGWKGEAASAFASTSSRAKFFRQICLHAFARGRLEMHALRLNGRAIAYLCLFSAQDQLYAFRTAYDEQFSRYAPGVLLAVWHSRMVHECKGIRAVDSCADPASQLDNELWLGRRRLASFRIP